MTPSDFLHFLGYDAGKVVNVKVLRDSSPHKYMILIQTTEKDAADEVFKNFNGRQFSTMSPEICTLLYVKSIELLPPHKELPVFVYDPEKDKNRENLVLSTEMPNCPVCLERLDENISGVLTILCNHSFHCQCLMKWKSDNVCPVCRYTQQPDSPSCCSTCGTEQSLWICLICGNVGCGRYLNHHARDHYKKTGHSYALECNTSLVWDYVQEEWVHRIVQNKDKGLTALRSPEKEMIRSSLFVREPDFPQGSFEGQDLSKVETVAIEYQLILEKQSLFYQEEMRRIEKQKTSKIRHLETE